VTSVVVPCVYYIGVFLDLIDIVFSVNIVPSRVICQKNSRTCARKMDARRIADSDNHYVFRHEFVHDVFDE